MTSVRTSRQSAPGYGISLVASWVATGVMMWRDYLRDPPSALALGASGYGHNHADDLSLGLVAITVEVVIAAVLLKPWGRPPIVRSCVAFVLALMWTTLSMATLMHTGGIFGLHFLWMVALTVHCFVALVVAVRRPSDDA